MVNSVRKGNTHVHVSRHGPGTPNGDVVNWIVASADHTSTDVKAGTKNPNWRSQIRAHVQAGTAYTRSATNYGFVTGKISGQYYENAAKTRITKSTTSGQIFVSGPALPTTPLFPSIDVNARINFLSQCRSYFRSFQGGVFLGELKETINMIARPGAALRRGISAYLADAKKAGRRASFTDRGRILTKTWLEHSYGWRPLIRDIESGIEALGETHHYVPNIAVGYAKDSFTRNRTAHNYTDGTTFALTPIVFDDECKGSVRYLGCVAWESQNRARDWKSNWGLTASDFLPTVWNLIPYSFIVDYFSNIGAVIDASSFGTVQLRWGIKSTRISSSKRMAVGRARWNTTTFAPNPIWADLKLEQLSVWSFSRGTVTKVSVGLNDIQMKVPGVSDWRKWANLSALAIERLY